MAMSLREAIRSRSGVAQRGRTSRSPFSTGTDREERLAMRTIQRHRLNMIRRGAGSAIASVMLASCLSLAAESARDHAPKTGLIVASSVYLVATPFDSAVTLVEAMTRLQQPRPASACCGGAWRVHFAVQLERPSGEETLELEFYDVASSDSSERRARMFSSEIATDPGDTTIFVNDFVISTDLGFAARARIRGLALAAPPGLGRRPWPWDVSRSASDDRPRKAIATTRPMRIHQRVARRSDDALRSTFRFLRRSSWSVVPPPCPHSRVALGSGLGRAHRLQSEEGSGG